MKALKGPAMKPLKAMFAAALCLLSLCSFAQDDGATLKPAFAGSWYSADRATLSAQLKGWMDAAVKAEMKSPVIALIQPHAGYSYSGPVAAFGAAQIAGASYKRVLVLGPSHRAYLKNSLCVPEASAMSTPLGSTPIDVDAVAQLRAWPFVKASDKIQLAEHSLQMQLPFLQAALKDFKVIPVIVGDLDNDSLGKAAEALRPLLDSSTLLVVSSDFTHYGSNYGFVPFEGDVKPKLYDVDMGAFKRIKEIDAVAFDSYIRETRDTVCGERPICLLLKLLPKDAEVAQLKYSTSGEVTGDFSNSVSYFSIAFGGKWPEVEAAKPPAMKPEKPSLLSGSDKKALLQIARSSLVNCVKSGSPLPASKCGVELSPAMKENMGAFVTLKLGGELRGCIGEIFPTRPLCDVVAERVADSALRDRRFDPVRPEELDKIQIEISALTVPKPVASYNDIELGRHGVTLFKSGRSAVFLPQVAPEQGWTLEQMLSHLSMKAGLPPDAWKRGASFQVFEAIVFHEGD